MMTINYTKALKLKQAESKLSTEALAKAIGVSPVSLRGILKGTSKPNATTAQKYAAYLGVVAEAAPSSPAKKGAKPTAGAKKGVQKSSPKATAKAKVQTKATRQRPLKGLGAELVEAARAASGVLDDGLALAVHRAGKIERELIARLLGVI